MRMNVKQQQTFLSKKDLKKVVVVPPKTEAAKVDPAPVKAKVMGRKATMSSTARAYILAHAAEPKAAVLEGLWTELSTNWQLPLEKKWYCNWYYSDMGRKGQVSGYVARTVQRPMGPYSRLADATPAPAPVVKAPKPVKAKGKKAK